MKAALLFRNKVVIAEVEEPQIREDTDVLVSVSYASICGYDMMMYRGLASLQPENRVGHEISGIVEKTGTAVKNFMPGDRVVVALNQPCGQCAFCRNGQPEFCANNHSEDGGMRERLVCPESSLHPLGTLSLRDGCLIEPLTLALQCVTRANLRGGERVLILGGGAMGLIILKLLQLYPVYDVSVADPHTEKRRLAKQFGAAKTFDPYEKDFLQNVYTNSRGKGYDVVIEASGNQDSAKKAFHYLARGASLVFFGLYGMDFELPLNLFNLYWKDARISAVYPASNFYPRAISLAARIRLADVITAEFPLIEAPQAFAEKNTGAHAKVVLRVH